LAKHPEYQQKVCDEAVKEFGNDSTLSYEKMASGFPFTKALIQETLRLKNPAYIVSRYTFEDSKIGEHIIPKNSLIVVAFCNACVNEKYWGKDALQFRPERHFEMESKDMRYIFTPFSMGPRVCIGKRFSEMEMILVIAKSMMKFRISPSESLKNVGEKIELTMKPSIPIIVGIKHLK
jgi:cytochrome P450